MDIEYSCEQFEPGLWTVGHYDAAGRWRPDSDHEGRAAACRELIGRNAGQVEYRIIRTEPAVWTVGYDRRHDGRWEPLSDHDDPASAEREAQRLNGG